MAKSKSLDFLFESKIITIKECDCLQKLEAVLERHLKLMKTTRDDLECLRIGKLISDYKKYIKEF